jgi:uncharacterized protein YciI
MKTILFTICLLIAGQFSLHAQQIQPAFDTGAIREYYLLILRPGPQRGQDSASTARIQEGHMAHLKNLYDQGKICLVGPVDGNPEIRGICVFLTASRQEALGLAQKDPAVVAGRLTPEIVSWYTMPGGFLPVKPDTEK